MRITGLDMYSPNLEEAITFSMLGAEQKGQYKVRTILGLDADEIIPKFYGWNISGSSRFYDFSLKPRDIVLRVILTPRVMLDETFSDVRDELYRVISANRTGILTFHLKSGPTIVSSIQGLITKFEAVHFTQLPEVQLTIRCNDPMFRGINPVTFSPSELANTNPVLIPDSLSTAPHGFNLQVTFKATAASFTIQDVPASPEWLFKIIPLTSFLTGDVLYLSSEYSNKSLYMIRGGVTTQLADRIQPGSMWPIIFPGFPAANTFHFVDIASFNWNSVQYYAAYWGV